MANQTRFAGGNVFAPYQTCLTKQKTVRKERITAAAYLVIGRVRHHDAPRSRLLTGTVRCRVLSRATIDAAAAARRCAATAVGKAELQAASGRRRGTSGSLGAPSCSAWECAAEVRRVPLSPMRARRRKDRDHDSAGPGRTGFPARFQSARRYHVRIAAKNDAVTHLCHFANHVSHCRARASSLPASCL